MILNYKVNPENGYLYTHDDKLLSAVICFRDELWRVLWLERSIVGRTQPTMLTFPWGKSEEQDIVDWDIIETLKNTWIRESEEESWLHAEDVRFFKWFPAVHNWKPYIIACFDSLSYSGSLLSFPTQEHINGFRLEKEAALQDKRMGLVTKQMLQELLAATS